MTVEKYRKLKPFIEAWDKGIKIGVPDKDKESIVLTDANPFLEYSINPNVFIINDEYVDFRLALMREEIIQIKRNMQGLMVFADYLGKLEDHPVEIYRIKPDADISWIKDGAYCRYDSRALKIKVRGNNVSLPQLQRYECTKRKFAELYDEWKPEIDELCWFWDSTAINGLDIPYLAPFIKMCGLRYASAYSTSSYENCIPYIGEKFWK